MIRFITFKPYTEYDNQQRRVMYSAAVQVNTWLEENPEVEIISWQATAISKSDEVWSNDLCITVQYKEN